MVALGAVGRGGWRWWLGGSGGTSLALLEAGVGKTIGISGFEVLHVCFIEISTYVLH